jgi:hypothetical protein
MLCASIHLLSAAIVPQRASKGNREALLPGRDKRFHAEIQLKIEFYQFFRYLRTTPFAV